MQIHRLIAALLCMAGLSACITPVPVERTPGAPPPETIDDTYKRVSQNPQNTIMQLEDTTRVVVEIDDAIYLFTKPEHPAHKSFLYMRNIKKPDGWYRVTTGYSENISDAFELWLTKHRKNDGRLQSQ